MGVACGTPGIESFDGDQAGVFAVWTIRDGVHGGSGLSEGMVGLTVLYRWWIV